MAWGIKDPVREAARREAVRAALYRDQRWRKGAFFGNVSPKGLRTRSQNSLRHGAHSQAVTLAGLYCDAVIAALGLIKVRQEHN